MNLFYLDKLYPLQDKVLKLVASNLNGFDLYLTGGTCLSRGYYNHRYSDDLDFFHHDQSSNVVKSMLELLNQNFSIEITKESNDFTSIAIDQILKVDFVRDVGEHWGEFVSHPLYPLLDNTQNILANKITTIMSRDQAKDVVDIWQIAKSNPIDWPRIFVGTKSKAVGIEPPLVAKRLSEFPASWIKEINWVGKSPSESQFQSDLNQIVDDILIVK
jgi:hypothetical protein